MDENKKTHSQDSAMHSDPDPTCDSNGEEQIDDAYAEGQFQIDFVKDPRSRHYFIISV